MARKPKQILAEARPDLLKEWNWEKNKELGLNPYKLGKSSGKKVWWKCSKGHEWDATVASRTSKKGHGCSYCSGRRVTPETSLQTLFPDIAKEWHPTKNGKLTPDQITAKNGKKVWWKCSKGHEWDATVNNRSQGDGCSYCSGKRVIPERSLQTLFPDIAKEWHPTKNGKLTPDKISKGSNKKVWWKCSKGHEWDAVVANRTGRDDGCRYCQKGWSLIKIKAFVESLKNDIPNMSQAELYIVFQQKGLIASKNKGTINTSATGYSTLQSLLQQNISPSEAIKILSDFKTAKEYKENKNIEMQDPAIAQPGALGKRRSKSKQEDELPIVTASEVLKAADKAFTHTSDEEAVKFFIASGVSKIWKDALQGNKDLVRVLDEVKEYETKSVHCKEISETFLKEYNAAATLKIPEGYSFTIDGILKEPNMMQRIIACKVRDQKKVGNWSGTGSGKTLSAILSSRVIDSKLTLICCPNNVIRTWEEAIYNTYPDSEVAVKTLNPVWKTNKPKYLVVNYEKFQQDNSSSLVKEFLSHSKPNFVVIDEIHFAKQREIDVVSKRKQIILGLLTELRKVNKELPVLGMSATPIINNLQEGKSLIELIVGNEYKDLKTTATINNCINLFKELVLLGPRWMPNYDIQCDIQWPEINCDKSIEEIKACPGGRPNPLQIEKILTKARLPLILKHLSKKTIIYTYYVDGIIEILLKAVNDAGFSCGLFTGENKTGRDKFFNRELDVLIASTAISTGIDGLQHCCNKIIINAMPWTNAEFEQLKGRIWRQGQIDNKVDIIIPITYAMIEDKKGNRKRKSRWSWCDSKRGRLEYKKTVADAAVDGVIPNNQLSRTPGQATNDCLQWLERLERGEVNRISRPVIEVPLPEDTENERLARYGDFSHMNNVWNRTESNKLQDKLKDNPEEWANYHTLYRKHRENWNVIPYEVMIDYFKKREGYDIGDFGCGEAYLAEALKDTCVVHSFDHIAINDEVIAGDMKQVPLDNESLDAAVFCLSLMGSNYVDYLVEAHRTLKLDGQIHIINQVESIEKIRDELKKIGFSNFSEEQLDGRFMHLQGMKKQ